MPAMTKFRRGSGSWVSAFISTRHYQSGDFGPGCLVCKLPIVKALSDIGMHTHPTCSEEDL